MTIPERAVLITETTASGTKFVPNYLTFVPTAEQCQNCKYLTSGYDRMICVFSHCMKNEAEK